MPKKKKNGQIGPAGQPGDNTGARFNLEPNGAAAQTHELTKSAMSELSDRSRDEIVRYMHDMFSRLDPDVIYIVLSEADFKVENAMDVLLELSDAAGDKTTTSPLFSEFEIAAAAMLLPCPSPTKSSTRASVNSAVSFDEESSQELSAQTHLTEEFDSLIDQELESLALVQPPLSSSTNCILPQPYKPVSVASGAPASPLLAQEALMELDQLDVDSASKSVSLNEQSSFSTARMSAPKTNASLINERILGSVSLPQETDVFVDFSHLTHDAPSADSRPSAFKVYRRPDEVTKETSAPVPYSQSMHTSWNIHASDFEPSTGQPAFITPVAPAPNPWTTVPTSRTQWMPSRPVSQAPLKPTAIVPNSWILDPQNRLKLEGQILVLLRGAPGSGKTTLAKAMLEQNPGGVVLSTNDYFTQNGAYHHEPHLLGEAHAWNHRRAKEAFVKGLTPIIIDNTNLQCWEMKPYVVLALRHNYKVLFREPTTWWKTKPKELEKRSKPGLTKEKIRRMLENQDRHVSVQTIMTAQSKPTATYGVDVYGTDLTEQRLGDPGFGKSGRYLSSSLPDVSTVDCKSGSISANTESPPNPFESFGFMNYASPQPDVTEQIEAPQAEPVDGADVELDACMPRTFEQVWAESICQRVKSVREQTRTEHGDASTYCDSVRKASRDVSVDNSTDSVSLHTEKLEFVGDRPSESLEQHWQRSQKSASQTVKHPSEEIPNVKEDSRESDGKFVGHFKSDTSNKTEFQKILDVLQRDNNQINQQTTRDFLPLAEDRNYSGLGIKDQPVLSDSILDWKSTDSSETGSSQSSNFFNEFKLQFSKWCTKVACADEHTPANGVIGLEQNDKPNSNVYQPLSPGAEVECGSEASQAKKKVPSRRAGKSCKLALTFMHQSPTSFHAGSQVNPLQQSQLNLSCTSVSVQIEPQDFALLCRINQHKSSEPESGSCGKVILVGNASRFVPKINEEKPSEQQVTPNHVRHERGSQVEENDFTESHFKHHSLEVIGHHFKHVPREILENLFEACCQDIECTTNMLLNLGEQFSGEGEGNNFNHQNVEGYNLGPGAKEQSCDWWLTGEAEVNLKNMGMEKTGSNYCMTPAVKVPNDANPTMGIDGEPKVNNAQSIRRSEHQPEESDHMDHANEPVGEKKALRDFVLESAPEFELFEKYPHGELKADVEKDSDTEGEADAQPLSQLELMDYMKEELRKEKENEKRRQRKSGPINLQTLELKLTTELALQLAELFGPVGISPAEFSPENCSVLIDLNLAELLHQKWKDTIQENHRQAALSYHLSQKSSVSCVASTSPFISQSASQKGFLFMDHWNVSHSPVSLRDIMSEEQELQDCLANSRERRLDPDKKDGATIVEKQQLFALFPAIDQDVLMDIFKDNNYSLEQAEQFLHTLMDDEPASTVVMSEPVCRATSKERKQKNEMDSAQFQDMEDPEYKDFRTEAMLQKGRQQECFDKAAEAYRQGRKDMASFYAKQGHLHRQKMKEANRRAAIQIFEHVNSTLLSQNILDLHGLHVNEALQHLQQVLAEKTSEWQTGLCSPQLSVITGRGNHSQGGVARIRPAVLDFLRSQHYKYSEPKLGLVIVTLHRADF